MSYDPPELLSPEEEAIEDLAFELGLRVADGLCEGVLVPGLLLSSYDVSRILLVVAQQFECTDLTHETATATFRLARR